MRSRTRSTQLMLEEPDQSPERRRELTFMVRSEAGREHVNFYDFGFDTPKSVGLLQVGWMAAAAEARAAGDLDRAAECKAKAGEIEEAVQASARTIVRLAETACLRPDRAPLRDDGGMAGHRRLDCRGVRASHRAHRQR